MMVKLNSEEATKITPDVRQEDGGHSKRESGEERRERILAASWTILSQVGFEKITTRRIAEAAGINIATLHYHFGNKEAVLTETVRYAQWWVDRRMRDALAGVDTAEEMMNRAFGITLQLMLRRPGILRFDLAVRGFRDEDARREACVVYGGYQCFVEEIIGRHLAEGGTLAPGLTVPELAGYMVAVVDGVLLHHTLFGDDEAATRNLNRVRSHVSQLMGMPRTTIAGTDQLK